VGTHDLHAQPAGWSRPAAWRLQCTVSLMLRSQAQWSVVRTRSSNGDFKVCTVHVPQCRELQQHLSGCVSVVRSLVTHMEALCEDYGELGRALSHFARFEESMAARQGQYTTAGSTAVQRGGDLQKLGYGALRQHSLSKQVTTPLTCQRSAPHWFVAVQHAACTTLTTYCHRHVHRLV
jgi:hypothetical protein